MSPLHSRQMLAGLVICLVLQPASCLAFPVDQLITLQGETMGTSYRILLDATDLKGPVSPLSDSVNQRLEEIESRMSTWRDDSEVTRFNRFESDEWFPVSSDTALVVAEALRIARASDGAFDPTVGPLIRLWHFEGSDAPPSIPTDDSITEAWSHTGYDKLRVRMEQPALRKSDPLLEINLSAIAKGFAVDAIAELLVEEGWSSYLVEIGGEMRAAGRKQDNSPWRVGIESPDPDRREVHRGHARPLTDQSIATSGDYRNFFEVDGQRYSHTIDPETGRPVRHSVASVSVVASTCMLADGLATAINVLGVERGLQLAIEEGVEVFIIERDEDGLVETASAGFPAAVAPVELQPAQTGAAEGSAFRTFLAVAAIFGIAVTGMAVGVIFSNRRLRGTCGGLNNMPGVEGSPCDLCQTPADQCRDPLARFRRKPAADASTGESASEDA